MSELDSVSRLGIAALVALVALAVLSGGAVAHGGDDGLHHHDGFAGMHDGFGAVGWAGWLWMFLVPLFVFGVPLAALFLLLRGRESGDGGDGALATLRERYARGEIDDEEFEKRYERLSDVHD